MHLFFKIEEAQALPQERRIAEYTSLEKFYISVPEAWDYLQKQKTAAASFEESAEASDADATTAGAFGAPKQPFEHVERSINMAGFQVINIKSLVDASDNRDLQLKDVEAKGSKLRRAANEQSATPAADPPPTQQLDRTRVLLQAKKRQLQGAADILGQGASRLRAVTRRSRVYYKELATLSKHYHLTILPPSQPPTLWEPR